MAELPKRKKTALGQQSSPDVVGGPKTTASSPQIDASLADTANMPGAATQIGGYDNTKVGGTVSLGRAMQENKTNNVGQDALDRMRKRMKGMSDVEIQKALQNVK